MAEGSDEGKKGDGGMGGWIEATSGLFDALASLLKAAVLAALVGLVLFNWRSFATVLEEITTFEFGGVKVTREAAFAAINELKRRNPEIDAEWARGAVVRATRNSRAINGRRILWVDDRPENNEQERAILQVLGITIHLARSTSQALDRIARAPDDYDLVVSDVNREPPETPAVALRNCPVHYFSFPTSQLESTYQGDLAAFNQAQNRNPQPGFALAERLAEVAPSLVATARPRMIFYSLTSGDGIAAAPCARTVTRRAAALLNEVISTLEESNWRDLQRPGAR